MNFIIQLNPTESASYEVALDAIKNPVDACEELYKKIVILTKQIAELREAQKKRKSFMPPKVTKSNFAFAENLYLSESYELMLARWTKLEKVK